MNWAVQLERVFELFGKALIEEPCLKLPVIEQKVGIDPQYDMLDNLIYDALREEDFPPLPIIDPKIVQWIDQLDEFEQQQLKSASDAHVQQDPGFQISQTTVLHADREEDKTVQAVKLNRGQQNQLQPTKCDLCNKEFQFPVNAKRHKWRHRDKTVEKTIESSRDQFRGYWEKLENEKAHKIISIKDAVLPANLVELQVNDILEAVSSYVEASDKESRCLEYISLVAFLLKPEGADGSPPFQVMLKALRFLSDENFFRGTLDLEMQRIVFPHAITMAKIEEQGLLASFEFLVEYCMMKAWADDRKHNADLLEKEEEESKKQAHSTASTSKASSSQQKKARRRKGKESKLSEKQKDDKGKHDSSKDVQHDSSSQTNQGGSKEGEKNTADKSSDHKEQDSSNAAATQSNLDDSIQDINYVEAPNPEATFDDGGSLSSQPGDSVDDNKLLMLKQMATETPKSRDAVDDDIRNLESLSSGAGFDDGGSFSRQSGTPPPKKSEGGQGESKAPKNQKQYGKNMRGRRGNQGQDYSRHGKRPASKFQTSGTNSNWSKKTSSSTFQKTKAPPAESKNLKAPAGPEGTETPATGEETKKPDNQYGKPSPSTFQKTKAPPAESKDSKAPGGPQGTETPARTSSQTNEETKIADNATRRLNLHDVFNFDRSFSNHVRSLRQRWHAYLASPDCIELEEYERLYRTTSKDNEEHDSSNKSEKNTADKSSEHTEQDSSNAATTQSNIDNSVQDINYFEPPNSEATVDDSAKDINDLDPPNSGPTFDDDGGSLGSQPGTEGLAAFLSQRWHDAFASSDAEVYTSPDSP